MGIIALPDQLFSDPEYKNLRNGHRLFLLDLYVMFNDCERFTIDMSRPTDYKQPYSPTLCRRINALLKSGLLEIAGKQQTGPGRYLRIFSFKHASHDIDFRGYASGRTRETDKAGNNLTH